MAQNVNRPPFNLIPNKWAFDPELGPFVRELLTQIWQLRLRTGGDYDVVSSTASASSVNFYAGTMIDDDRPSVFFNVPEEETVIGETSAIGVNSTISTLAGGASFNAAGTGEQNDWPDVGVSCYADVAGTLYFDFSVNGTDWRTFPTAGFVVSAGIHEFHIARKLGRYFRARYVNGSSAQSTFQLFTYYGKFGQAIAPMNQPQGLDADATVTVSPFTWLQYARGKFTGVSNVKKFGRNAAVGTSFVPVALGGIYRTPQAASATTLRIKAGGNANDTAAGSGARQITIVGLDENFESATETLTTAGALASSSTTTTFTRVFRAYVSQSGTYATAAAGSHAGDIVIENSAGTEDWFTIDSTSFPKSQTEIGAYTIPANTTGYVKLRDVSIDSGKTVDLIFFSRTDCDQSAAPYSAMRAQFVVSGITGGSVETFGSVDIPFGPYVGPTDIGFMAKVSTGTASVSVEFEIFIVSE